MDSGIDMANIRLVVKMFTRTGGFLRERSEAALKAEGDNKSRLWNEIMGDLSTDAGVIAMDIEEYLDHEDIGKQATELHRVASGAEKSLNRIRLGDETKKAAAEAKAIVERLITAAGKFEKLAEKFAD